MKIENTKNTFKIELDESDVQQYRYIYLNLWKESAELGPNLHIESTIKLLLKLGYKITKGV